jgi:integrase
MAHLARSAAGAKAAAHTTGSHFLQSSAVEPRTHNRYRAAVSSYMKWRFKGTSVPLSSLDCSSMDSSVSDYLHHLYFSCSSLSRATATVYGLQLLEPRLKGYLHSSKLALRGWRRITPHRSYPPMTWDTACVVSVTLAAWGHQRAAIAVLLSFDCYLRIGEVTGLRRRDVVDSSSVRMGSNYRGSAIMIPKAKTGRNQSVDIRRPVVAQLLADCVKGLTDSELVFGLSAAHFRQLFKRACRALGLSRDYVPHSLRHGGATCDFLARIPVADIVLRGRWASLRTASRYVQAGKAMLAARTDFPADIGRLGAWLSSDNSLRRVFALVRGV